MSFKKCLAHQAILAGVVVFSGIVGSLLSCSLPGSPDYGRITLSFPNPRYADTGGSKTPAETPLARSAFIAACQDALFGEVAGSAKAIDPDTASFRATISAEDIPEPIEASGSYDAVSASVTLTLAGIPVGMNRLLSVIALDAAGNRLTEGSVVIPEIRSGDNPPVPLAMRPLNPEELPVGDVNISEIPVGSHRFFNAALIPAIWYFQPESGSSTPVQEIFKIYDSEGKRIVLPEARTLYDSPEYGRFEVSAAGEYFFYIENNSRSDTMNLRLDADWRPVLLNGFQDYYGTINFDIVDRRNPIYFSFANEPPTAATATVDGEAVPMVTVNPATRGIRLTSFGEFNEGQDVAVSISFNDPLIGGELRTISTTLDRLMAFIYVTEDGSGSAGTLAAPCGDIASAIAARIALTDTIAVILMAGGDYQNMYDTPLNRTTFLFGGWDGNPSASAPKLLDPVTRETRLLIGLNGGSEVPYYLEFVAGSENSIFEGFTVAQAAVSYINNTASRYLLRVSNTTLLISHNTIYAPMLRVTANKTTAGSICGLFVYDGSPIIANNRFNPADDPEYTGFFEVAQFTPIDAYDLSASAIRCMGNVTDMVVMNNEFFPVELTTRSGNDYAGTIQAGIYYASSIDGRAYFFGNTFHENNGAIDDQTFSPPLRSCGIYNIGTFQVHYVWNNNFLNETDTASIRNLPYPYGYYADNTVASIENIPEFLSNNASAFQFGRATSYLNEESVTVSTDSTNYSGAELTQGGTNLLSPLIIPSYLFDDIVTWIGPISYTDIDNARRTAPWSIGAYEED